MNTATAEAQVSDHAFTPKEALELIANYGAAFAWKAVEEFEINLGPPRLCAGKWLAQWKGEDGERVTGFEDSLMDAVKDVLRKMGGINGK